mmetsp:Transcript_47855/g.86320  ORF Transcript_47855/g.86320 Transcript_47855/m.86320 type:complete len:526 (-) Transcript_47855:19-1596(-)
MLKLGVVLPWLVAAGRGEDPSGGIRVDSEGLFRDSLGRARLFHGVNAVFKEPDWLPSRGDFDARYSLNEQDAELLRAWGFNMVRLGVMWPGIEPSPGVYDDEYLEKVGNMTKMLARQGVGTLLDMHQDLLSRRYCGEGLPEHYVDALLADPLSRLSQAQDFPFPIQMHKMPTNSSGYPDLEECFKAGNFANFYATEKVGALFAELYDNSTILHAGFLKYWDHVASHFSDYGDHILGYELLNEPSSLCMDGLMSCFPPQAFWQEYEDTVMAPLYREAASHIRRVDKDRPIFFESSIYPKVSSDLFSAKPLGNDSQQVFAYHIYCNPGHGFMPRQTCYRMQDLYIRNNMKFLDKQRGLGGFMTEFGAIGDVEEDEDNIDRLLNLADEHFQSWAYWSLKDYHDFTTMEKSDPLYDENGSLEKRKLKLLSRTYAPAVSGTPEVHAFHASSGNFTLRYVANASAGATEVYLNEDLHYPDGYAVSVLPDHCLTSESPEKNRLNFHLNATCNGRSVEVHITRKPSEQTPILI